jgi:AcrR family transcriptional regulator
MSEPHDLSDRATEIVIAARRLLDEQGPDGLTMRRLGEALGIKAPSIYKHLPDKQSLETALISDGFEEMAGRFTEATRGAEDPLRALAIEYRAFARQHPHLYRLMTQRELDRARIKPGVEAAAARPLVDAFGGDEDLARAAFAFVHGMTLLELDNRFPPGADIDAAWTRGVDALKRARNPSVA